MWEINKLSFVAQKCRSLLIYIAATERNRGTLPHTTYLPVILHTSQDSPPFIWPFCSQECWQQYVTSA
jgi:hypothetical protein